MENTVSKTSPERELFIHHYEVEYCKHLSGKNLQNIRNFPVNLGCDLSTSAVFQLYFRITKRRGWRTSCRKSFSENKFSVLFHNYETEI